MKETGFIIAPRNNACKKKITKNKKKYFQDEDIAEPSFLFVHHYFSNLNKEIFNLGWRKDETYISTA